MPDAITLPESFHALFYVGLMFVLSQSAGHIATRLKMPQMIGYICGGILFGPYVMGWFNLGLMEEDLIFFRDFALAVIAFSIGGTLQMSVLRHLRSSLLWITLLQTTGAALCVFIIMFWLLPFALAADNHISITILMVSIILASVSTATDPASILTLVDEYDAKGNFRTTLLGLVAIDDIMAVVFYTIAIAIIDSLQIQNNGHLFTTIGHSILTLGTEITLGLIGGFTLVKTLRFFSHSMLGILLGIIMLVCGFFLSINLSPLLTCMVLGFVVTNLANHDLADEAMEVIYTIQPPIFGVFFFMAGAQLNITLALSSFGFAMALTLARFAGKYGGTRLGGMMSHTDPSTAKNLGIALLPAAGVMMGLTMNAKDTYGTALGDYAELMVAIVIGATLINELLTPFFVRHAIRKHMKNIQKL